MKACIFALTTLCIVAALGARAGRTRVIEIRGDTGNLGTLRVCSGDVVQWLNLHAGVEHLVLSDSCPFACHFSSVEPFSDQFSFVFVPTGHYPYHSDIGPSLVRGVIAVECCEGDENGGGVAPECVLGNSTVDTAVPQTVVDSAPAARDVATPTTQSLPPLQTSRAAEATTAATTTATRTTTVAATTTLPPTTATTTTTTTTTTPAPTTVVAATTKTVATTAAAVAIVVSEDDATEESCGTWRGNTQTYLCETRPGATLPCHNVNSNAHNEGGVQHCGIVEPLFAADNFGAERAPVCACTSCFYDVAREACAGAGATPVCQLEHECVLVAQDLCACQRRAPPEIKAEAAATAGARRVARTVAPATPAPTTTVTATTTASSPTPVPVVPATSPPAEIATGFTIGVVALCAFITLLVCISCASSSYDRSDPRLMRQPVGARNFGNELVVSVAPSKKPLGARR